MRCSRCHRHAAEPLQYEICCYTLSGTKGKYRTNILMTYRSLSICIYTYILTYILHIYGSINKTNSRSVPRAIYARLMLPYGEYSFYIQCIILLYVYVCIYIYIVNYNKHIYMYGSAFTAPIIITSGVKSKSNFIITAVA